MSLFTNEDRTVTLFCQLSICFGQNSFIVTGKLQGNVKPTRQLAPDVELRADIGINPDRRLAPTDPKAGEAHGRVNSARQMQGFLAAHDQINTIFRPSGYQLFAIPNCHVKADAPGLKDYAAELTA